MLPKPADHPTNMMLLDTVVESAVTVTDGLGFIVVRRPAAKVVGLLLASKPLSVHVESVAIVVGADCAAPFQTEPINNSK